jgi:hypothetical protein
MHKLVNVSVEEAEAEALGVYAAEDWFYDKEYSVNPYSEYSELYQVWVRGFKHTLINIGRDYR